MQFCYKPGDKVVIRREDDFDWRYRLETVEAITPSSQIWCTDKSRFLPSGNRIGEVSEEMLPATDEHIQLINAQELRQSIRNRAKDLLSKLEWMELAELERTWQGILQATYSGPGENSL